MMRGWNGDSNGGENYNSRQIAALQDSINTNHNNDLAMQALANNQDAVRELAQAFNTSLGNIQMAVCNVKATTRTSSPSSGRPTAYRLRWRQTTRASSCRAARIRTRPSRQSTASAQSCSRASRSLDSAESATHSASSTTCATPRHRLFATSSQRLLRRHRQPRSSRLSRPPQRQQPARNKSRQLSGSSGHCLLLLTLKNKEDEIQRV